MKPTILSVVAVTGASTFLKRYFGMYSDINAVIREWQVTSPIDHLNHLAGNLFGYLLAKLFKCSD